MTAAEKELQMLVTGYLAGALTISPLLVEVTTGGVADDGYYEPFFYVRGQNTGAKLRVLVMAVESSDGE